MTNQMQVFTGDAVQAYQAADALIEWADERMGVVRP